MIRSFAVALTFLTRTPLDLRGVREDDFGRSLAWFPAVGLLLGLLLAWAAGSAHGRLSAELIAVGLVALLAGMTGGLHLDGVADVVDGLSGGRGNRERTLEIMRDSRIGSHGAVAIVIVLLAKVFAILELVRSGTTWPLMLFPVAARWSACALVVSFPYARKEGLGKAFNGHARGSYLVVATGMTAAIVAVVCMHAIIPTLAALATAVALALWVQRRIGGLTGDVYGAAIELAELAFLVVASLHS